MGLQLIFVVETNRKCKSDWIYIRETIDRFYRFEQTQTKFTPVYMDGKGNYLKKEKEISRLVAQYASTARANRSKVLYCFDCDDYDSKPGDADFLRRAQQYCAQRDAELIWFCKDVERVYLGKKVDDSQKKQEAAAFKAKRQMKNVKESRLEAKCCQANTSNILKILDAYLTRK